MGLRNGDEFCVCKITNELSNNIQTHFKRYSVVLV